MTMEINTENFWDSVSQIYSGNSMTTHAADFEMFTLFKFLFSYRLQSIEGIASFGIADGNRDPIQIIKFILENKMNNLENFEIIMNDISAALANDA